MNSKPLLIVTFIGGLVLAAYAYGEGHPKSALACMAISLLCALRVKPINR